ncbi:hypothetical protein GCM10020295_66570 [Streptomyces cinereospinus]
MLAARTALHGGPSAPRIVVCALCCVLWLGFLLVAHRRIRTLAASGRPVPLTPRYAGGGPVHGGPGGVRLGVALLGPF